MKVSIIIPHFNQYKKLFRLLDSIPQSEKFEIIVIDDYSNNLKKEEFEFLVNNERIVFVRNKENKGAGYCRNIGIEMSTGDYLIFSDSDDYFITENLSCILEELKFNKSDIIFFPPIGKTEFQTRKVKRGRKSSSYITKHTLKPSLKSEVYLRYQMHVPWSKIYRKKFIMENGIRFDEIKVSNDVMFTTKAGFHANEISTINKSIYVSVKTKNSLTTIKDKKTNDIRLKTYLIYLTYVKEKLSKKERKYFKFSGLKYVYRMFINDKSVKTIFKAISNLKKAKIGLFVL
ncbi:TPA: glycosyltransferase family 2 protein [bacterium]|nr:glycosyltransferase family 2 protein [bacterium]